MMKAGVKTPSHHRNKPIQPFKAVNGDVFHCMSVSLDAIEVVTSYQHTGPRPSRFMLR
jgi:hypothetical protein